MSPETEEDWIASTIKVAQQTAPVACGIASTLETALRGAMSERALRPGELKDLAATLIESAVEPPDAEGANNEN